MEKNAQIPLSRPVSRGRVIILLVVAVVLAALAWQLLNKQQYGLVAGRPLSAPQTHLHTLAFSGSPGVVYLGTHLGLFTSTDGGHSWPQSQGELSTNMITSIAVSPTNPRLLAVLAVPTSGVGRDAGVYVSSDGGTSWHFTLPAHLSSVAYPYLIQSGTGAKGRFYAFFSNAGWFETQDLGQHWYAITSGNLANLVTPSLLVNPANPNNLLMGGSGDPGLFETSNDGHSWQQIAGIQGSVVSLAASTPTTQRSFTLLCATDQGLYRWQSGQPQAIQLSHLPTSIPPTRLIMSANGAMLYALFGSDLWFSADQGISWVHRWHFTRTDLISLALNPTNPLELLAGFFAPGLVLVSNNGGSTWQTLTD
jgi:photosystem II stability/assembly factor-like uncharacterized protein